MDPLKVSPPQETKLHFLDYWRIIRIRKTVILSVFILVVITATLVTLLLPVSYDATASIKVDRNVTDISGVGGDRQNPPGSYDPYYILTEFEVLQSEAVLTNVIHQLNLNEEWGKKYYGGQRLTTPQTLDMLKKRMDLHQVRSASVIEIRVLSEDREEAAGLANAIAQSYADYRLAQYTVMTQNGIKALKTQFEEQEQKVRDAQTNVDQLRTDLKILDSDPMSTMPTPTLSVEELRQYKTQLITLNADLARQQTRLDEMKKLSPEKLRQAIATAVGPDSELSTYLTELDMAEQRLIAMELQLKPDHPDYMNARQVRDDLENKVKERVNGIITGLQTTLDSSKAAVERLQQEFDTTRTNDLAMAEKSRPYYDAKQRLAEALRFRELLTYKIASEQTDLSLPKSSMVEIINHAYASQHPVRPNKPLNIALGIVIGLVVGVGLAFFIEYLDTSVKTIDDIERTLQAPVLGVIPQNVGFLVDEGAESPHAEAYRVLRTNLLFSRKNEKLNTIAIVSAGAGEGKSTTVFNLAAVFAQSGNRVLIVDSDLRRPTLHKMLRVTNSIGLTNYLLKQNPLEEVIQTTSLTTLDFMASGKLPSSSLGILSSAQMKSLIAELKQRYDFIFFDSPPIMGVSDASILASEVDLTLQVIQYRRYPQPMNIRAKQMIEKVGGNLVGIVLNNINMSQDESYYYYSGYYHEYYAKNDEDTTAAAPAAGGDKQKLDIKKKF